VKIEWLPEAERNRKSQLAYIAERNPRAAIKLGDAIEAAVARLALHPESARPGRVPGTRELVVPPFVIVHRSDRDSVVIIRLLHGRQEWPGS
jgi:toxin ParE1/3/4